ncbi:glycosyltransferase family 2 protein [Spirosoma sp.]|uniref:glycosyltransferase family 2 protein n=1 Tax=Spirosoma sp. TaxID=1899569 RepID=UPI002608D947|nr:glycosyltransferase family 2 protein [Spirosoma sp.]MCX6219272.1 glycosyltransferase family 2 protein [Spirosoma sp.]
MKRIAAVVVTYNRLNDLKICLASLHTQTRRADAIYVVNNGSTDGTDEWLKTQPELIVLTQANLGGAGGFATGIERTFQDGFDDIWCMDDDCIAAPDALENLLLSPNIGPAIKNCVSISVKDHEELAFYVDRPNQSYRKVTDMTQFDLVYGVASLFNGTLISAEVIRTIGIPDKKLFIWGDEVEYMTRAQKMGFPVVTVPTSVFYHPPSFDRNGIPWPGAWKQYYAVRNQRRIFQNMYGSKYGIVVFLQWSIRATLQQAKEKRQNRLYNFLLYGEAAFDSLLNNFRKRPETIFTVRLYRYMHK